MSPFNWLLPSIYIPDHSPPTDSEAPSPPATPSPPLIPPTAEMGVQLSIPAVIDTNPPANSAKPWSDNPNAPQISYDLYFQEKADFSGILIASILYGM